MMIALLNQSDHVSEHDARAIAAALAHQIHYDLAPAWHRLPVPVVLYPTLEAIPPDADIFTLINNADVAGALGFHDETPDGRPYARGFTQPILDNGGTVLSGELSISAMASHEGAEMTVNRTVDFWVDDGGNREIALEASDPCEDMAYDVHTRYGPVSVSDFVFPAYFDVQTPGGAQLTQMSSLSTPWSCTKGGYLLTRTGGKVNQTFGDEYPEWKKATKTFPAARTAKRLGQSQNAPA